MGHAKLQNPNDALPPVAGDERGALATEVSITVFLFLSVMFSLMTLGLFVFHQATLQFVVNRGMRIATLGVVTESGNRIRATPASVDRIESEIQRLARDYGFTLTPEQITVCSTPPGSVTVCGTSGSDIQLCPPVATVCATETAGTAGDMILIRARTTFDLFGLFPVPARASAIGRVETSQ